MASSAFAPEITDPVYQAEQRRSWAAKLVLPLLNDERDLSFIWLALSASLVLFPCVALLYWPGVFSWWLAPLYWAVNGGLFLDRYILMLHNTSHRPLFKKRYRVLNNYIPWVLGPLFGESPETYFAHHMGMHHPENNLRDDLSSTMRFQRDRFSHFLRYWGRFFVAGIFELVNYHRGRGRNKLALRAIVGEVSFLGAAALLSWVNWQATLVVFVVPLVVVRFLMMAGNWGQHAFIDATRPDNCYVNSITCINTRYNRRCFNDGYHIGHHIKANRHWSEMPEDFARNLDAYVREGAIVFEGIDFFQVWLFLMLGRYDWLARHYVDLKGDTAPEAIAGLLRSRTLAIVEV